MEIKYLCLAIHALAPGAEWKFNDDNLDTLEWFSDSTPPTKEAIIKEAENQKKLEIEEIQLRKAAKASAMNKLIDLGLTEDEAKAFLG